MQNSTRSTNKPSDVDSFTRIVTRKPRTDPCFGSRICLCRLANLFVFCPTCARLPFHAHEYTSPLELAVHAPLTHSASYILLVVDVDEGPNSEEEIRVCDQTGKSLFERYPHCTLVAIAISTWELLRVAALIHMLLAPTHTHRMWPRAKVRSR